MVRVWREWHDVRAGQASTGRTGKQAEGGSKRGGAAREAELVGVLGRMGG